MYQPFLRKTVEKMEQAFKDAEVVEVMIAEDQMRL